MVKETLKNEVEGYLWGLVLVGTRGGCSGEKDRIAKLREFGNVCSSRARLFSG